MATTGDPEKDFGGLGFFYLGREMEAVDATPTTPLLYDSRDLVTHAVIVGMTGSGKTGLGIALLEEAALDGIGAIVVDPKGDLGNLLLTFPELAPGDFRPWVDEGEAQRKGLSADALAAATAETWRKGLAEWGQDGGRIARLRAAADLAIFTPGSEAGRPVSVLGSLARPADWDAVPGEDRAERAAGVVSSILALAGVEADPVQSPEHIVLSLVLRDAWDGGTNLRLEDFVRLVLTPPFDAVGALPLEEFFPSKARTALSMRLNALVASPAMERWKAGEPLDVGAFLRAEDGRPRVSIFSIAHLSDAERMFFVSLLASETVSWMRRQSGTQSLRALFFMDEIFGYFPPTAEPPSKRPMLTMLKQGRAFGLGCVLATQNPVDLDYKGLTNAGTWFVGRLSAQRDKERLLDGLESATAAAGRALDRAAVDRILSALPGRTFLMNNVHDDGPVLFRSRWALSFLRGPMTRDEVARLQPRVAPARNASAAAPAAAGASVGAGGRPALPADVPQLFLPAPVGAGPLVYRPCLLGAATVAFHDAKAGVDATEELVVAFPFGDGAVSVDWERGEALDVAAGDPMREPEATEAGFLPPPAAVAAARSWTAWKKSFAETLYRTRRLILRKSPSTGLVSRPGEDERSFRDRLDLALREERDAGVAKIRTEAGAKLAQLEERLRRAEERVAREKLDRTTAGVDAALSVGTAVLGALFGRRKASMTSLGRAASAARGVGRTVRQHGDVAAAEEGVEVVRARIAELEEETRQRIDDLTARLAVDRETLVEVPIRPKKADISVTFVVLGWRPVRPDR